MAKRIPYTVLAFASGAHSCANCGAKLVEGDAAVSVFDPDGISYHQHAQCQRPANDGASKAARLMNDIRAGKPPVNPDPAHAQRKVQGK